MKVGREQDSLLDKVNEIYEDCKDNAAKAKGKAGTSRDFRDASGCWDVALKAVEVLIKRDPDKKEGDGPKESAFWLAYGERAKVVFDGKQT